MIFKLISIIFIVFCTCSYVSAGTVVTGGLWGSGDTSYGQLGNGSFTADSSEFIQIGSDATWRQLGTGGYHSMAVKWNGTLWTWGLNDYYQLALGDTTNRSSPVQVGSATDWLWSGGGYRYSIAQKTSGALYAIGINNWGQLGLGDTTDRTTLTQIGSSTDWSIVSVGTYGTLAIKTNGDLYAWGGNFGDIGNGTLSNVTSPTKIGTSKWRAVSKGFYHSLGIQTDGTLWAWGENTYGQLGDGTTERRTSPVKIGIRNDWRAVAAGGYHSIAIRRDGTVWAWGRNSMDGGSGQVGDGTIIDRNSPVQVLISIPVKKISAGYIGSFAIDDEGSMWSWGCHRGECGQSGDWDTIVPPTKVGTGINWSDVVVKNDNAHAIASKALYVDINNDGGTENGASWATAWGKLTDINWSSVSNGDTIFISGGATTKTYEQSFRIEDSNITVRIGQETNHNGKVIIDGTNVDVANDFGIWWTNLSNVTVSGRVGGSTEPGIWVKNWKSSGSVFSGTGSNFLIEYIDYEDNCELTNYQGGHVNFSITENVNTYRGEFRYNKIHGEKSGHASLLIGGYNGSVTDVGNLLVHHNEIYSYGNDGVNLSSDGCEFYNNSIHSRGTYFEGAHPDHFQFWSGYTKIYNNTFTGLKKIDDMAGNSFIRFNPGDTYNLNPTQVYIYNNIFYETGLPSAYADVSVVTHGGLTYTCKGSHFSSSTNEPGVGVEWTTYWSQTGSGGTAWQSGVVYNYASVLRGVEMSLTDAACTGGSHIYILNNVFYNISWQGLSLGFRQSGDAQTVSNIMVANNIFLDSVIDQTTYPRWGGGSVLAYSTRSPITYGGYTDSAAVTSDYNLIYASSSDYRTKCTYGSYTNETWEQFKIYSGTDDNSINSDPKLTESFRLSSDSPARGKGVNLSSIIPLDKDGNERPASGAWDIGAYEYEESVTLPSATGCTISGGSFR